VLVVLSQKSLPSLKAAFAAAPVPHKVMICAKLVISSYALKNGYLPLSMQRKMTPADHMSTAGDCWGYFRSTSGERNPGVPARGVFWWPLHHTKEWDCVSDVDDTCRIKIKCILENWTRTRPHYCFISTVKQPSTHRHENAAFRKHFLNGKNLKMHALRVEGKHFEKDSFAKPMTSR